MPLHPQRLFPTEPAVRAITNELYQAIKHLPIISPHGHCDPNWFAHNKNFSDPVALFIQPDHYLLRMLYSQGVSLQQMGIQSEATDKRAIWSLFCQNYHLFRGTPSRLWLDHSLYEICGVQHTINANNSDKIYDHLMQALATDAFKPRALFKRFNIELLATTESPLDDLAAHKAIANTELGEQVITTYRPDCVIDPEYEDFADNLQRFATLTGETLDTFTSYLQAHRIRRQYFKQHGATATDHGHPTANTANLDTHEAEGLYQFVKANQQDANKAELFRAQMLTEMAKMSIDDGLVMQLHAGCYRNHNRDLFQQFGRDKGGDLPIPADYVNGLKPILDCIGNDPRLTLILFTLDETTYSRELAPLAGHYPSLRIGPAWWFYDSVEGMRRYKKSIIETAGFYNLAGFNDDTRAFLSIPARHDMARRIDCGILAELVAEHQITIDEAHELAITLTTDLVNKAYRLKQEQYA
ncbi:MAG: glucuronate isomerase [Coxiellaceae bacterium]|nr:glucuronate isomerase [Coxiellaceae bacterium]